MKRKIYIPILFLSLLAASCRMWEKDDDLRPSPDFGFTTGTSTTGYKDSVTINTWVKFGIKATHDENMESLVVTEVGPNTVVFEKQIGAKTFTWLDSIDVGTTLGQRRYDFMVKGSGKERIRTVFIKVLP